MKYPKKCIDCESGDYQIKNIEFKSFNKKGPLVVPDVEILECDICGEQLIPAASSKKISKFEKELDKYITITKLKPMKNLQARKTTIENKDHPEWGTFGVYEDCGEYYEIHGRGGSRVLSKDEAQKFWRVVK